MWITKRKLKNENAKLIAEVARVNELYNELLRDCCYLQNTVAEYRAKYPFEMGQVVYDVQLRSSKGRFTKTKASREHSLINEVIVDKKNYFNLVERYINSDVFTDLKKAENHLNDVCVE